MMTGIAPNPAELKQRHKNVDMVLDVIEKTWLENGAKKYLCGEQISVADIMACCELEQPSIAG